MEEKFNRIFTHMLPALVSKKNEFHFHGYTSVTVEELWTYCVKKLWKNKDVTKLRMHQIASDILRISPATYMTYVQVAEQRKTDWFSDVNNDELQTLLEPKIEEENK